MQKRVRNSQFSRGSSSCLLDCLGFFLLSLMFSTIGISVFTKNAQEFLVDGEPTDFWACLWAGGEALESACVTSSQEAWCYQPVDPVLTEAILPQSDKNSMGKQGVNDLPCILSFSRCFLSVFILWYLSYFVEVHLKDPEGSLHIQTKEAQCITANISQTPSVVTLTAVLMIYENDTEQQCPCQQTPGIREPNMLSCQGSRSLLYGSGLASSQGLLLLLEELLLTLTQGLFLLPSSLSSKESIGFVLWSSPASLEEARRQVVCPVSSVHY